jgi:hypothetical protein
VLAAFIATRVIIVLLILVAAQTIPLSTQSGPLPDPAFPNNVVLDGLVRWNSFWYASVVHPGYLMEDITSGVQSNVIFFPGYPLLIRLLAPLVGNQFLAGILTANAAFLVALVYLYALTKQEFDDVTASRAVFYLAAAPASVFFCAMYAESLTLLFILATFYHARNRQWGLAGLAGLLAAATHISGVLMALVIVAEGLGQQDVRLKPASRGWATLSECVTVLTGKARKAWRSLAAAAIVPVGLIGFMIYLGIQFNEPLGFWRAQAAWGWDISGAGALQLVNNTIMGLRHSPMLLVDLAATLGFAALVVGSIWESSSMNLWVSGAHRPPGAGITPEPVPPNWSTIRSWDCDTAQCYWWTWRPRWGSQHW